MADEKTYTLVSADGKKFPLPQKAAFLSNVVQDMQKNLGEIGAEGAQDIPVPNVSGDTLEKICEWLMHHKDDPAVNDVDLDDRDPSTVPEWDKTFLNVPQMILLELILASNYLDIKGLLDNCCKVIAQSMKGKTVEELRSTFSINNDFSPDEEEQIRRENAWCED